MAHRSRKHPVRRRGEWISPRLAGVAAALILSAAVGAGPATAGYPERRSTLNDFAGVLEPGDEAAIRGSLADFRASEGIEAVVVTVRSIRDYHTGDASIESFATHLFNAWGIGDPRRNDGVLVLVAVADHQVRIEVGSGYGRAHDAAMKAIIERQMLPRFRRNDVAGGLRVGVAAIRDALAGAPVSRTGAPQAAATLPAEAPASTPPKAESSSPPGGESEPASTVGWIVAAGAGLLTLITSLFLLLRPRRCPDCRTKMRRLDELSEDEFLDASQQLEENLGSVNYDVWRCDGCGRRVVARRPRFSSSFRDCPRCGVRALRVNRETLVAATYYSTGEQRVTRSCQSCDFSDETRRTLPRLVEHQSSSTSHGSSGGGGHSSGGGASGSW